MRHDTNTNAEKEGQAQDIPKGTGGLRLENCWEGNGKALHSLGDASITFGVFLNIKTPMIENVDR